MPGRRRKQGRGFWKDFGHGLEKAVDIGVKVAPLAPLLMGGGRRHKKRGGAANTVIGNLAPRNAPSTAYGFAMRRGYY